MSKVLAYVCGLFLLCAAAGCDPNGKQAAQNNGQIGASNDVNTLLSTSPDHPWILTLTVVNVSDHVVHVLEMNGIPETDVFASQGEHKVKLHTRAQWNRLLHASYAPFRRSIPPNEKAQYSLDLSSDYIDSPEPKGNTLQHVGVFDHKQPVDVWVTMPNPDQQGAGAVDRTSNSVSLNLDQ